MEAEKGNFAALFHIITMPSNLRSVWNNHAPHCVSAEQVLNVADTPFSVTLFSL